MQHPHQSWHEVILVQTQVENDLTGLYLSRHLPFNLNLVMYLPAVSNKDRHFQMANHPILRETSKLLPAFPMDYRQTEWLVQARWLRMNELNPSLSHSLTFHRKAALAR